MLPLFRAVLKFCSTNRLFTQSYAFDKSVKTIPITPSLSKQVLHVSSNLRRTCCVLYPSLNPHNRFDNFGPMNGNICEYISLSNIFNRGDKTLIGRKFLLQVESPDLYTGVTSDPFRLLGKVSISNDLLICRVISS